MAANFALGPRQSRYKPWRALLAALLILVSRTGLADGKLLATSGATQLEGAGGGGLVPWALLAGYGTADELGGQGFLTHVGTGDYTLTAYGAVFTTSNRLEISYAQQRFDLGTLTAALNVPHDTAISQNIFGAKLRLFGDAVYTSVPQVSLGLQYKQNLDFEIPQAVGARHQSDVDVYLAAGKLLLAGADGFNLWVNGVVRLTRANQLGILGFGGDRNDSYQPCFEGTLAVFLDAHTALGVEYRQKPDNLRFATEESWKDVFVAYFFDKHLAAVAAYAHLGPIAGLGEEQGPYLSVQAGF